MWIALLLACVGDDPAALPDDAPTSGHRIDLPPLSFSTWSDVIALQAGADDDCRFLDPLVDDATTTYPPLQAFWVIHDPDEDVTSPDGFFDTFFLGDHVTHADFPARDGLAARGLSEISGFGQSLLPLDAMDVDGRFLYSELGSPIDVALQVELAPTPDGCGPVTEACTQPCDGDWVEISGLHLELGLLYTVQEVQLIAPGTSR